MDKPVQDALTSSRNPPSKAPVRWDSELGAAWLLLEGSREGKGEEKGETWWS